MPTSDCTRCANLLVLVVSLSLSACSAPSEPPEPSSKSPQTCLDFEELVSPVPDLPITYQTEHLDIHVAESRFLCAGSAVDYELFVQHVANELGIEIQRRMPVYAMSHTTGYCSKPGGCATRDGVVFALDQNVYHELAHGVACEIDSGSPAFLAEGLASTFDPYTNDSKVNSTDLAELAELRTNPLQPYYYEVSHFVRWLLEQLGPDAFRDIYRSATYDDGVWQAIEAAYGPAIAEDYAAEAPLMWIQHRQCADMPLLEPDAEGAWTYAATLDCDEPTTLGPYEKSDSSDSNGSKDMYQSFLIDIPAPGKYRMERSDWLQVKYERCLDEHPMTEEEISERWVQHWVFFTFLEGYAIVEFEYAGLWRFDVLHDYGTPVDIWLTIVPEPG
ncbi:MAG: hypothetical protein HC927_08355 [Deltaproteobacteria bacterium]|nr:hypothetical protein [Deltaproteobacteria bacterium]